ncbi:hypothetical protein [Actinocrispum sp. NPDC049592]|uniref:hypothetical protein n=1 Tax=Actinocrispum sp. NPDC049592 TaxID=3154835 RepID=UPI0034312A8F
MGRGRFRSDMYDLLQSALGAAGIAPQHHDPLVDRGDGVLALIHPHDDIPKTMLLTTVVPALARMLAEHNAHNPHRSFRLRAVLHAGEVHHDSRGCYGEDLDLACRLLDAPAVKHHLEQSIAPVVLVVSEHIYHSVIRHGYDGIDDLEFTASVDIRLGGRMLQGRLQLAPTVQSLPALLAG